MKVDRDERWLWQKLIVTKVDHDDSWSWRKLIVTKVDCDECWSWRKLIVTKVDRDKCWLWQKLIVMEVDFDESLVRSPLGTLGRCSSAERYFASLHNQDRVQFETFFLHFLPSLNLRTKKSDRVRKLQDNLLKTRFNRPAKDFGFLPWFW